MGGGRGVWGGQGDSGTLHSHHSRGGTRPGEGLRWLEGRTRVQQAQDKGSRATPGLSLLRMADGFTRSVTAKKIMASRAVCAEGCNGEDATEDAVDDAEDVGDREVPPRLRAMGECLDFPPLAPPLVRSGESPEPEAALEPPPAPPLLPPALLLTPAPAPALAALAALVGVTDRRG